MKLIKHLAAGVLAALMILGTMSTAMASSVVVKYHEYVYSDEITFLQYNYTAGTTPSLMNLTVLADSSLGSGSALYHVKYVDGQLAYCVQPGVHADDSSNYNAGSPAAWYNMPAAKQSGVGLAMALGYPNHDYGTDPSDTNTATIIQAEKYAATQAAIWGVISEYLDPYTYFGYWNPFVDCVDEDRYPTFYSFYDALTNAMERSVDIPIFASTVESLCDPIELVYDSDTGNYTVDIGDMLGMVPEYNYPQLNGNGYTFRANSDWILHIEATPAAIAALNGGTKTFTLMSQAVSADPTRSVLCYYDRAGYYQALGRYTGTGIDPARIYFKVKGTVAQCSLQITKVDGADSTPLPNVGYRLYNSAGTQVGEGYTNASGVLSFSNLTPGVYTYKEFSPATGYALDSTSYTADMSTAGTALTVTRTNNKLECSLQITKVDGADSTPLPNVGFRLYNSAGTQVKEGYTGADGKLTFTALAPGSYTYKEFAAPTGYVLDTASYPADLSTAGTVLRVTRTNEARKASITVHKLDSANTPISGVELVLESSTDGTTWTQVATKSTDADGNAVFSGLSANKSVRYRLTETKAAPGYSLMASPLFEGTLPLEFDKTSVNGTQYEIVGDKAYLYDAEITAVNAPLLTMPFTGGNGFAITNMWSVILLCVGIGIICYIRKTDSKKEND